MLVQQTRLHKFIQSPTANIECGAKILTWYHEALQRGIIRYRGVWEYKCPRAYFEDVGRTR